MRAKPGVSVVIPTYQRRHLVTDAVRSVLAQTYRDFELIVVDDGSVDGTEDMLSALDGELHYHRQPNRGVGAARNTGVALARGSIVAFLDSDDVWLPDHLATLVETFLHLPDAVMVSTSPRHRTEGAAPPHRRSHFEGAVLPLWESGRLAVFDSCPASRVPRCGLLRRATARWRGRRTLGQAGLLRPIRIAPAPDDRQATGSGQLGRAVERLRCLPRRFRDHGAKERRATRSPEWNAVGTASRLCGRCHRVRSCASRARPPRRERHHPRARQGVPVPTSAEQ